MSPMHDPELDDVMQDEELRRLGAMLSVARVPDPPLDEAFRTALRRQLMTEAWAMSEGRPSWLRRLFAPPGLAWAGATAGLLLIATVVVWATLQQPGGLSTVYVTSPIDGSKSVALQQPILVAFTQPMDHTSTQNAVQITPATTVTYSWDSNSRTLAVQPTGGTLAPNTQYQVTIGPGAKTAAGKPLTAPQTITFVTTPPPTPAASPTPRPTPANPLGEKQLVSLGGGAASSVQWAADSSSLYFVDNGGALKVVTVSDGTLTTVAPDGSSSPSVSPAGDRLAYIRAGKIEVLTFASGKTDELAVTPAPLLAGWAKDQVVWAAADGLYEQNADGSSRQVVALPTTGTLTVVSIAPDGAHAVYQQDQSLFILDVASGKSTQLGQPGAVFQGWSPAATDLLYSTSDNVVVADLNGVTQTTLPAGDATWSGQDAILLGGDTDIFQVRPDGTNLGKLANGTYRTPIWAPNGAAFAFVRGGALWVATAPALPSQPTTLDAAARVVDSFMKARLNQQPDAANAQLDANGKAAYAGGPLSLLITGDPSFSRYYVLTSEMTGSDPDTARFVVRLVMAHGKIDVSETEEVLTLVRDTTTKQFLIDQATQGAHRNLGQGAEVVAVDVQSDTVKVTFDSDLDPTTIGAGVILVDSKGKQLDNVTATYANRVVTLTGLHLKEGEQYRLVVLTSVRDVLGNNVAAEYDLDLVGPLAKRRIEGHDLVTGNPSPSPAASS